MNLNDTYGEKTSVEAWQSLVHVCQRWRILVLESRRRLNLQLYCTTKTRAIDKLDVWPALPLIVGGKMLVSSTDHIIPVLGQTDRVCQISLRDLVDWQLESLGCDAGAISGVDRSAAGPGCPLTSSASRSRFVPGWICPTSAILCLEGHTISGTSKAAFVCYSPCPPFPQGDSSFWVHFTQSAHRSPLRVVQP